MQIVKKNMITITTHVSIVTAELKNGSRRQYPSADLYLDNVTFKYPVVNYKSHEPYEWILTNSI